MRVQSSRCDFQIATKPRYINPQLPKFHPLPSIKKSLLLYMAGELNLLPYALHDAGGEWFLTVEYSVR
jgi:hypothetical protein